MTAWASDRRRSACAALCCFALLSAASAASAQTPPAPASADASSRVAARELGDRGLAAYDAGDYPAATQLFRQALERYDFPTLRLYLARSLSKQGSPVAACHEYEALLARPVQADEGESGVKARAAARQEQPEVAARRPRLTLLLEGPGARDARVDVSGPSRPNVVLGRELFVEPGRYQVRVTHPDGRALERSILLSEGQAERLELGWSDPAAPALAPPQGPSPAPTATATALAAAPAPPVAAADGSNTPAWLMGAFSGVLLGGAILTGVLAASLQADFNRENRRSDVDRARKRDLRQSAYEMQVANTAFAAAAVVGAGVTAYLVLRRPDPSSGSSSGAASARSVWQSGWQLGVRGEF